MIEAGKFLLNRLIGWWDGLSPAEQKVYGGIWAIGAFLLLVTAAEDAWPMIIALGAIGGYFLNEYRKARKREATGEGAADKPAARAEAAAAPARTASAAAAKPAAAKPKAAAPAKPAAKAKAEPEPKAARGAATTKGGPPTLAKPRGGKADDLKMLKGVGPRLETILNEMGFYHYDQIAAWTPEEVAWVDDAMSGVNKGRASRDGWVEQAKVLAGGGQTAFAKRVAGGEAPTSQG